MDPYRNQWFILILIGVGPLHNHRATSGYIVLLAGALISWRSAKQASVVLSSNKAEYIAASEAARKLSGYVVYLMRWSLPLRL
jgi:hypothetical protein